MSREEKQSDEADSQNLDSVSLDRYRLEHLRLIIDSSITSATYYCEHARKTSNQADDSLNKLTKNKAKENHITSQGEAITEPTSKDVDKLNSLINELKPLITQAQSAQENAQNLYAYATKCYQDARTALNDPEKYIDPTLDATEQIKAEQQKITKVKASIPSETDYQTEYHSKITASQQRVAILQTKLAELQEKHSAASAAAAVEARQRAVHTEHRDAIDTTRIQALEADTTARGAISSTQSELTKAESLREQAQQIHGIDKASLQSKHALIKQAKRCITRATASVETAKEKQGEIKTCIQTIDSTTAAARENLRSITPDSTLAKTIERRLSGIFAGAANEAAKLDKAREEDITHVSAKTEALYESLEELMATLPTDEEIQTTRQLSNLANTQTQHAVIHKSTVELKAQQTENKATEAQDKLIKAKELIAAVKKNEPHQTANLPSLEQARVLLAEASNAVEQTQVAHQDAEGAYEEVIKAKEKAEETLLQIPDKPGLKEPSIDECGKAIHSAVTQANSHRERANQANGAANKCKDEIDTLKQQIAELRVREQSILAVAGPTAQQRQIAEEQNESVNAQADIISKGKATIEAKAVQAASKATVASNILTTIKAHIEKVKTIANGDSRVEKLGLLNDAEDLLSHVSQAVEETEAAHREASETFQEIREANTEAQACINRIPEQAGLADSSIKQLEKTILPAIDEATKHLHSSSQANIAASKCKTEVDALKEQIEKLKADTISFTEETGPAQQSAAHDEYKLDTEKYHEAAFNKDLYAVLGVASNATTTTIRDAFLECARRAHPDKDPQANAERIQSINEASEVLLTPRYRVAYDDFRKKTTPPSDLPTDAPPREPQAQPAVVTPSSQAIPAVATRSRNPGSSETSSAIVTSPKQAASRFFLARTKQLGQQPQANSFRQVFAAIAKQSQHAARQQEDLVRSIATDADKKRKESTATKAAAAHEAPKDKTEKPAAEIPTTNPGTASTSSTADKFDKSDPDPFSMGKEEYQKFVEKQAEALEFYQDEKNKPQKDTQQIEIRGETKTIDVLVLPFHEEKAAHQFLDSFVVNHPELKDQVYQLNPEYAQTKQALVTPQAASNEPQMHGQLRQSSSAEQQHSDTETDTLALSDKPHRTPDDRASRVHTGDHSTSPQRLTIQ
ncbi:MAG: DnaJ domain-containing protein [Coxiellaceae bacterium]|nr:DnaJ domain-containing protein [Coxiellaceae bacterium]